MSGDAEHIDLTEVCVNKIIFKLVENKKIINSQKAILSDNGNPLASDKEFEGDDIDHIIEKMRNAFCEGKLDDFNKSPVLRVFIKKGE